MSDTSRFVARVGTLRIVLALVTIICMPLVFFSGGYEVVWDWSMIPNHVVPGLVVIIVWGLLFDMLMARVFMAEKEGAARERYKTVLKLDGLLLLGMCVFWGPFFWALFTE